MSSPSQAGPSAPKEEKKEKGLSKLLTRTKTFLKREGSSNKRLSTMSTTKAAPAGQSEPVKPSEPVVPEKKVPDARARYEGLEGVSKLTRSQLIEERAKKLGERYGLDIKISELQTGSPDDTVLRMDKPIRMRVRRTCHKCNATFSSAKECPNCQHARCTKCTRYPPKRTEAEIIASRERRAAIIKANKENAPIIPDYSYGFDEKKIVLTRPSKTGGQDLVHKKPRQRVRRTCHECSTLFISGNKTCEKCGHVRCTDCPRDPPKKDKYPYGYPGDEFGPSSVPHYECKDCKTVYPTGAENGTKCKKCGLEKTDNSPRVLPRKVEPEPDPELLKKLQERLENLKVA
ncbi:hypothetical protein BHE90_006184 [Fusarium euwallaceae]|uniref:Uncharacterized protein n=4 Tax=Fusarium solani species complex TaxID=232080 RepID=A0A3M2SBP9_9HYPO|nr:hypothetical protein CDV36_005361 [Fusarium kuroshium]RSL92849.1 hypothetical protein CEP52_013578 [Fusarium oligoseptatum]RSM09054.1 hypothetical protein CDV31_007916 [Fusarium ambrosium]RTE79332.1 hypothetical protein BHE90_006184 [Fusarium euwallaceae]